MGGFTTLILKNTCHHIPAELWCAEGDYLRSAERLW